MAPKTYTTAEVAEKIGVSRQTIQTWIAKSHIDAPKAFRIGGVTVRLWKATDIQRLKKFKGTLKRGGYHRKKK